MKIISIFSIIIAAFNMQAQTTPMDTVFVKRNVGNNQFEVDTLFIPSGRSSIQVLAGTTFLPYTDKMIGLLNRGLSPISLEVISECDDSWSPKSNTEYPIFLATERNADTLTIDVAIVANCCHNFLGEAEVIGSDTLNLVYTSYGNFCSCQCCFTLRYKFDTSMELQYGELKHVSINNSRISSLIPRR